MEKNGINEVSIFFVFVCLISLVFTLSPKDSFGKRKKSPISIHQVRSNFATFLNDKHPGNRIGYRFHEHVPIIYGNIPLSNEDAEINIRKINKLEAKLKKTSGVFIYEKKIDKDDSWAKQDWKYYLKPVTDGVEIMLVVTTYNEGFPEYYGIQQCFRMSGARNEKEWRKEIANTPAFSEYDLWESQPKNEDKLSLTYVLRNNEWQAIPATEKTLGARTPAGIEIDNLRTNGHLMAEVGPYKAKMLEPVDSGIITRNDKTKSWVCGIYWQNTSHVTNHHPADCLHSIIDIGNIPPHSKKAFYGKIYWFKGSKDDLFQHLRNDFN